MHRTNHMLRTAFGLALLGLTLGNLSGAGNLLAQEVPPAPRPVGAQANVIIVPIGLSRPLQMKGKQDIRSVFVQREEVAQVQPSPADLKTVVIRGLQPGRTTVTLTADDGKTEENYEIIVQLDVEFLRTNLQQVVPTANLILTPVGGQGGGANMLAISGVVQHVEDINVIMRIAESMMGAPARVINQMRTAGVQQVQLDVVVARVSRTELRAMDFDFWNPGLHHDIISHPGQLFGGPNINGSIAGLPTTTLTFGQSSGNVYVGLYEPGQWLAMFMNLLRTEQLGKLLAEPKLVTMSGKQAYFQDGGTFYLASTGGINASAPQAVQFGTRLTFLPVVLGNGKIYLEVEPDISSIGETVPGSTGPSLTRQQVRTVVEMEDGQTFVIGGLVQNVVTANAAKIPVLGDMPFIGAFFSHKFYQEQEFELVVLVTPHLIDPLACNQVPKLLPGQETRTPDDFELFLEGLLEAPRGPRDVCHHKKYVAAWKNSPSAAQYPCGGGPEYGRCNSTSCGSGLADVAPISYPNGAPANGEMAPVPETGNNNAALLPPVEVNDAPAPATGAPATTPPSEGKPPSLFGPTGYNPQQ